MEKDLLYQIGLTLLPKVGNKKARILISYCGSPQAVFESSKKTLLKIPTIGEGVANEIICQAVLCHADQELKFIERNGIQPLYFMDENYPSRLKTIDNAPVLLYYKGEASLNAHRTVGIVGTRKPSAYGVERCKDIVKGLRPFEVTTISGLAYGVDVAAHKASLAHDIPTIGVVAHGLDLIYPARHRSIEHQILERGGGILSEYPCGTRPDRERFPMRNRIIAGLSDALVVVESGRKGGSMISAEYGVRYKKDVFTFPGRVTDPLYQGNNYLLKNGQAEWLETAADIANVCHWKELDKTKAVQRQLFVELNEEEAKIIQLLQQENNPNIDDLRFHCGQTNSQIASHLLQLEFKGMIRSMPGKRYALVN